MIAAALVLLPVVCAAQARAAGCAVPPALSRPEANLPHVAAALHPGGHLAVLAVGSGALAPPGTGDAPRSFADIMIDRLRAAAPGATVDLTVRSQSGRRASDMLPILRSELAQGSYGLVLWQTGTVEATKRLPLEEFRQVLRAGLALTRSAGADLVLIDPPFNRALHRHTNVTSYEAALQDVATEPDVVLFHRYDLMLHWVQDHTLDLEHTPAADRHAAMTALNECLGTALAGLVLNGPR